MEFNFDNVSSKAAIESIEQQSPIIERELLTTEQQLENFRSRLAMSETVSAVTQSVLETIRKEYNLSTDENEEELEKDEKIVELNNNEILQEYEPEREIIESDKYYEQEIQLDQELELESDVEEVENLIDQLSNEKPLEYYEQTENLIECPEEEEIDCSSNEEQSESEYLKEKEECLVDNETEEPTASSSNEYEYESEMKKSASNYELKSILSDVNAEMKEKIQEIEENLKLKLEKKFKM